MSHTLSPTSMSTSDLAQILFASPLQASGRPTPEQVRAAIDARLCACGGDHAPCAAYVAQEAGDHPEAYTVRMRWALHAIALAFPAYTTAA
ncbi:hypothetical protein [Actinomadura rugatobispora]|uniref:Zinc-finger domain-containing protein n=1 Tax=Actinomadura rugatobispora TaxID=1994 RepID=A0ABW0ZUG2_9ACTN|nr:hypothetical protein GCM10010200_044390 [Actinomadura rugatobispora]